MGSEENRVADPVKFAKFTEEQEWRMRVRLSDELYEWLEKESRRRNNMGDDARVLTCVYCGMAYPQDTPAWGNKVLTDHIKICEKHPMTKLRKAFVGLVGSDTKEELEGMEVAIRLAPVPDADKAATINAIHALLDTL